MSFAFRLHDYRVFCVECSNAKDVRAIDESDAEREAKRDAWMMIDGKGLMCPLCVEFRKRDTSTRNLPGTNYAQEKTA
jgi:hypothetical protein